MSPNEVTRRSIAKGAAWSIPAIAVSSSMPVLAASHPKALCTTVVKDQRFSIIGDGAHKGEIAVNLAAGTPIDPIYFDIHDEKGIPVRNAELQATGVLPGGLTLSRGADGRWAITGVPTALDPRDIDRSKLGVAVDFASTVPGSSDVADGCKVKLVFYIGGWDINLNTAAFTFGGLGHEWYINVINEGTAPTPAGLIFACSYNCIDVSGLATGKVIFTSAAPYGVEVLPYSDGNKLGGFPSVELTTGTIKSIFFRVNKSIEPGGVLGINAGSTGVVAGNKLDFCFRWMVPQPSAQYVWEGKSDRHAFWHDEENAGWREKNNKIFYHSQGGNIGVDGFVVYDVAKAIRSSAKVPAEKVLFNKPVPELS